MKYTVYVLRGRSGLLYKGMSSDLEKRISAHNAGLQRWTKSRGPLELVYREDYDSKREALIREKFLKSGQGREFLKAVLGAGA